MTIAVDWDAKQQNNLFIETKMLKNKDVPCF